MGEESLITDEMRSKIGVESEPEVYEVTKEMIQRFIQATGDSNPLWQDEEHAKKSKYGGIIAPPTIIPIIGWEQFLTSQVKSILPEGLLHSSTELECYQPVREGDVITLTTKISDVREKQGKMGKMIFVNFDTTYSNQSHELVARCRQKIIGY